MYIYICFWVQRLKTFSGQMRLALPVDKVPFIYVFIYAFGFKDSTLFIPDLFPLSCVFFCGLCGGAAPRDCVSSPCCCHLHTLKTPAHTKDDRGRQCEQVFSVLSMKANDTTRIKIKFRRQGQFQEQGRQAKENPPTRK